MTPEQLNKIQLYRQKCNDNSITMEEMKEAIRILRESRVSAAQTARAARKSSVASPGLTSDDILNGL